MNLYLLSSRSICAAILSSSPGGDGIDLLWLIKTVHLNMSIEAGGGEGMSTTDS